ncbi:aldehyde dehydrogenase family protein [Actinoallomurus purpureus]|uniref:aldehyde dehydrogenase family protein n=1 Tax=Actinoallomurus purpureus TaxID=478114 RepID=UPI002093D6AD|nr:aldehyde dehydrogenase family protein [Actinoallomurus purpureus]MCO6010441.1 aldehyde dehydrogenase family protein [Actinoallomurus purpureus]
MASAMPPAAIRLRPHSGTGPRADGPLAPVVVVSSFEEGLEKASDSRFGLASTVYTDDPAHIAAARGIPAGVVSRSVAYVDRWDGCASVLSEVLEVIVEGHGRRGSWLLDHEFHWSQYSMWISRASPRMPSLE